MKHSPSTPGLSHRTPASPSMASPVCGLCLPSGNCETSGAAGCSAIPHPRAFHSVPHMAPTCHLLLPASLHCHLSSFSPSLSSLPGEDFRFTSGPGQSPALQGDSIRNSIYADHFVWFALLTQHPVTGLGAYKSHLCYALWDL